MKEIDSAEKRKDKASRGRDTSVYEWRMDAGSEQKVTAILKYFPEMHDGAIIADMGSGTGLVAQEIVTRYHRLGIQVRVIAVDISHEFYEKSKEKVQIELVFADAATQVFPPGSVDVIYFSTSGHEIESFAGKGKMLEAIRHAYAQLKPGGRLIIRDFVRPETSKPVYLELLENDGKSVTEQTISSDIDYSTLSTKAKFLRFHAEFAGGSAFNYRELTIDGKSLIEVDPEWAYEFYMRKEYTGNWRNEIHEKYSYWSLSETHQLLEENGFTNVVVEPDPNDFMLNNWLRGKVGLYTLGTDGRLVAEPFPATHMLVAATKPQQPTELDEASNAEATLPTVDFQALQQSIVLDLEEHTVNFQPLAGKEAISSDIVSFLIDPSSKREGKKFQLFKLADDPSKVVKFVSQTTKTLPYDHQVNLAKAFTQIVERQSILLDYAVPHLRILDYDRCGPPYRFVVQESLPAGAISMADLLLQNKLTQETIASFCSIIERFEKEKRFQVDSNPFAWYLTPDDSEKTKLVYASSKVYSYDERWSFTRVGLPQWCMPEQFLSKSHFEAAIPTTSQLEVFYTKWCTEMDSFKIWKETLASFLQPDCKPYMLS